MSTALLQLSENGSLQNLTQKWLTKKNVCQSRAADNSEQLKLKNFIGLFLICGIACILALIIYFCSMLYQFHQHLPQQSEPSSQGSTRSARLKTFLSFADKKEDLSQGRLKRKRISTSMPNSGSEMAEVESGGNSSISRGFESYRENNHSSIGWNQWEDQSKPQIPCDLCLIIVILLLIFF